MRRLTDRFLGVPAGAVAACASPVPSGPLRVGPPNGSDATRRQSAASLRPAAASSGLVGGVFVAFPGLARGLDERDEFDRLGGDELAFVRRLLQEVERLVRDGETLAAAEDVAVVDLDLLEGPLVDERPPGFGARILRPLGSDDGDRAEFDAADGPPGGGLPLGEVDAAEAGVL